MQLISSDTNVWVDFSSINRVFLPFRLDFTYLMQKDMILDELVVPKTLGKELMEYGLKGTELSESEFWAVEDYLERFPRLSRNDCMALAIAKKRSIPLLSGDKALRKAAEEEQVRTIGTIFLMDELLRQRKSMSKNILETLLSSKSSMAEPCVCQRRSCSAGCGSSALSKKY